MSEVAINAPNLWRLETPGHTGWQRTAHAGDPKKYFMVSTDSHANEPADLWAKRLPPEYRERVPRIITDEKGVQWRYCEGYRPDRVRVMSFEGEDWRRAAGRCRAGAAGARQPRRRRGCGDHLSQQGTGDVGDAGSGVLQRAVPGVERLGVGAIRAVSGCDAAGARRSPPATWTARWRKSNAWRSSGIAR